ncbi:hypothetical protein A9K55_007992 [Cordyceps militaris]|uniref:Uncharacterized protein n=1 Tax=Cordyceps militaris TaxID=73501 RepID=A0A2H4SEL4_CORMI|nr:hypothetical protein A9K55_007992 [Cordyceps militaris]
MANQITLMQFLQQDPPGFQFQHRSYSNTSTKNRKYENAAITSIGRWGSFNIFTILQQYDHLINIDVSIASDALVSTPPPLLGAEDGLRELVATYVDRPVRRALARTFEHLAANNAPFMRGRTPVTLGAGSSARTVDEFMPDRAFYDPTAAVALDPQNPRATVPPPPPNRLPGEIKPSHKWSADWLGDPSAELLVFSRLGQLSYYMVLQGIGHPQHRGAKYGYMINDKGLVAFRKVNAHGSIEHSDPIPWGGAGDTPQRLTVMLALWYLGMLASSDSDWTLPTVLGDPGDEQLRASPAATAPPQSRPTAVAQGPATVSSRR